MTDGRPGRRRGSGVPFALTLPVWLWLPSTATEVGATELFDFWPLFVRAAWFLGGCLVVLVPGWYLLVPAINRFIRIRNPDNPTLTEAISRYVRVLILGAAVFLGLGVSGFGGVLADSAVIIAAVTLAIGVAGREVIGSFVSGLALVVDPEFNVGNAIEWPGGEGTVESITLRVTRVLSSDGALVTVPNTVLTGEAIVRPYGRGAYRIVDRLGVDASVDPNVVHRHVLDVARGRAEIRVDPAPRVYIDELEDGTVTLDIHYWIDDPRNRDIRAVRSSFTREVRSHLEKDGVSIGSLESRDGP